VKGDQRVQQISAASIIAKVARDTEMQQMHDVYPEYGFDSHKGYPTKQHIDALRQHGVTPIHRRSFSPVRNAIGERTE
jgi:ribonuclease HII